MLFATESQGQPMDLFHKISVLQADFWWLGDLEEIICPWKESVAGEKTIQGVWGAFMCKTAGMCYFLEASPPPPTRWKCEFRPLTTPKLVSNVCWENFQ